MSIETSSSGPASPISYARLVASTQETHRLFSVHWELTYRCNERCSHCYLNVLPPGANVPGELTTEECLRVIDQLAEAGALNITLSGGEILVRHDLFEIAEYARAKRFLLRLFTNGTLIRPAVADRIAGLHPYAVEVSIYGADAETHERITRLPRSFELTINAVRMLRERGLRVVMKTPLMRENVRHYRAIEALAAGLGARFRYDITITPKDTGGLSPLRHRMTDEDLLWLFRETLVPSLWTDRNVTDESRTCGIARNAVAIDPFGNVFPCLQVRALAGNVRDKSIKELWEASPIWQELGSLTLGGLPVCRTCELRNFCVRCHGLAQMEVGDLRRPALVNCREALARRQVLSEIGLLPVGPPIPAPLRNRKSQADPVPSNPAAAHSREAVALA